MNSLNLKQQRFVAEYLIDRNATQAAIRAGYRSENADVTGPRLLSVPAIAAAVRTEGEVIQAKALVTAEYVLVNLREVVERCMQKVPVMQSDAIQKIDPVTGQGVWRFDAAGAIGALALLGKHLGLFTERVQLDIRDGFADRLKRARERIKAQEVLRGSADMPVQLSTPVAAQDQIDSFSLMPRANA